MDCNKDEALRAKEVAERKFIEKDYEGAKKFAQKAKRMYPGLDFISLFVTIVGIYCSRERMVDGQPDWYGILGVEQSVDLEIKHESYWKLAPRIEASRNNVVGAEGAYQILSEAWCMLSDTFWTKCSRCHFYFQYFQIALSKTLKCKNCGECFVAVALPSGNHPMSQRPMSCFSQNQDTSHDGAAAVLVLGLDSPVRADEGEELKHSKSMNQDGGESSNKAPKVKGSLQRHKMSGKDAMQLSSSEIRLMLIHKARTEILKQSDQLAAGRGV